VTAAVIAAGSIAVTGSSGSADVSSAPNVRRVKFQPGTANGPAYDAKSVIVQFKPKATTSARKAALAKVKGTPDASVTVDVVTVTGDVPAPELLKKVKADPTVELASLNYIRRKSATPNDWLYTNYQKYLPTVRVDKAWDLSKSAGTQTIGVLDTGVDAGHPDLVGHLLPGYNTFNTALAPNDGDGHGTAVTGIIAAGTGNSTGIAGVAWNAKVRPIKVLDDSGSGDDTNLINGLNWAVKNGVRVINMSLGGEGDNPVLHTAIQNAVAKGVVLVAAAGNTGGDSSNHFPGAYPEVLSVGATNQAGVLTSFSSYGDAVDIAAPGYDITSTAPRNQTPAGYEPYWLGLAGTSFSSPIVAGVAALVRNKWPSYTPAQVMARLKATARDAGPRGNDPYYGAGILDAYQALGGKWTTDFPQGAADKNDQPARAGELIAGVAVSSTISVEGDVDWYKLPTDYAHQVRIEVTGPMFDSGAYAQNFGPVVSAYDENLKPLAYSATLEPPVDSHGYEIPQPLTTSTSVNVPAGTMYVAVRNANGSRDSRSYTVKLTNANGNGGIAPIDAYPVLDASPGDLSSGVSILAKPTVTFPRNVDENSVTSGGVKLLNGKTGAVIPATVTYDHTVRRAEIAPTSPLAEATPFRIVADGVVSLDPTVPMVPFTSVFSTEDRVPQPVQLVGVGAYLAANLTWTIPPTTDLDQVIVRRNVGSKAPTTATGTLVYAGTGNSVRYDVHVCRLDQGPCRALQRPARGEAVAGDEVGYQRDVDADQLRRRDHDQGQHAADRQPGVRRVAGERLRTAEELVEVHLAGGAQDVVDRDAVADAQAARVVGLHADVPRERDPDGHPHRRRHRPGQADDLGDPVPGVHPPRRDHRLHRVRRPRARRPDGLPAAVWQQGVEVDRHGQAEYFGQVRVRHQAGRPRSDRVPGLLPR
jgi:type VII secretion-associated serine protease mycosin